MRPFTNQLVCEIRKEGLNLSNKLKFTCSGSCVVMFIDMISSTRTSCEIRNSAKLRLFYEIFVNVLSEVASNHGARIIKNGGDSIFCYFPRTMESQEKASFREVLNCGLKMIQERDILNAMLQSENLPPVSYRISADYGRHEIVKDSNFDTIDLFGPTICLCSKINILCPPNNMVIGSDLHEIAKSLSDFVTRPSGEYKIDQRQSYPIYLVKSKKYDKPQQEHEANITSLPAMNPEPSI